MLRMSRNDELGIIQSEDLKNPRCFRISLIIHDVLGEKKKKIEKKNNSNKRCLFSVLRKIGLWMLQNLFSQAAWTKF